MLYIKCKNLIKFVVSYSLYLPFLLQMWLHSREDPKNKCYKSILWGTQNVCNNYWFAFIRADSKLLFPIWNVSEHVCMYIEVVKVRPMTYIYNISTRCHVINMIFTTFTHILIDCFICFVAIVWVFNFGSLYDEVLKEIFEDKVKISIMVFWEKTLKFKFLFWILI